MLLHCIDWGGYREGERERESVCGTGAEVLLGNKLLYLLNTERVGIGRSREGIGRSKDTKVKNYMLGR